MDEKKSFGPEFAVYSLIAALIRFYEEMMDNSKWVMSPSRFYLAIYETISWFRERNLWHFNEPAFLYVMEQCEKRAQKLAGSFQDEDMKMEMAAWRDREAPIPGGNKSVLQIFDWFVPILRGVESKVVFFFGNPSVSPGGNKFQAYEAWDTVFYAVDKLYKDKRFGKYNDWGQPVAYPWVAFVRDEMYEMREFLRPTAPPIVPGEDPPFSAPSGS